jgi:hypothetical protein
LYTPIALLLECIKDAEVCQEKFLRTWGQGLTLDNLFGMPAAFFANDSSVLGDFKSMEEYHPFGLAQGRFDAILSLSPKSYSVECYNDVEIT